MAGVIVENGKNGTVTDQNGAYNLSVKKGTKIKFSLIGYRNQEIPIENKNEIDIILKEDQQALNEVVVVGYGNQQKINLSGAVDQISARQLEQNPITDINIKGEQV